MLTGIIVMLALAAITGLGLLAISRQLQQSAESPIDIVNAMLPQTQCGQCGYPGCRPYAQAIINAEADINQCAPGGDSLVTALAHLLGRSTGSVDPAFGMQKPLSVARINEEACIGCALCIAACPVDAIVGAARYTHTVIREDCTGCDLCVAPCPVDCIIIEPLRLAS
jgi:electron transport complex protein RnfB